MINSLAMVREAIATELSAIGGLEVHETIGGSYNVPFAVVLVREITEPRETFSRTGTIALPITVLLFVSRAGDDTAQISLDEYLDWAGESSVGAALEANHDGLNGLADSVQWTGFRLLGADEVAGYGYLGGEWTFVVRLQRET